MKKKLEKCRKYLHNSMEKCNYAAESRSEKYKNYAVLKRVKD